MSTVAAADAIDARPENEINDTIPLLSQTQPAQSPSPPTHEFAERIAATVITHPLSAPSTATTPAYRSKPHLFDAFKNSRVKAAASSLQQRFSSSIQQLNQFESYQKKKDGVDYSNEAIEARNRARIEEEKAAARLERSVMKPKVNTTLFAGEANGNGHLNRSASALNTSHAHSLSHTSPTHQQRPQTAQTLRSPHRSHMNPTTASPLAANSYATHVQSTMNHSSLSLGLSQHHDSRVNQSYQTQHDSMPPPPPRSPIYQPNYHPQHHQQQQHQPQQLQQTRPHSAQPSTHPTQPPPSKPVAEDRWEKLAKSQRLEHIRKAMDDPVPEEEKESKSMSSSTFPRPATSKRPSIQLTEDTLSGPSIALAVSRPIRVATVRKSPLSSPRSLSAHARQPSRSRSRSRSTRPRKKSDGLPKHVTRLLQIQGANAAKVGTTSSDDSDDDVFERRRRLKARVRPSPVVESPALRRFQSSPKPDLSPSPPSKKKSLHAKRVSIHKLAETLMAEDADDHKEFAVQPTPRSLLQQAAMLPYQSLPPPSYSAPPSNLHIHLHSPTQLPPPPTAPLEQDLNSRSSTPPLQMHRRFSNVSSIAVESSPNLLPQPATAGAPSFPDQSPRMATQHPASWMDETGQHVLLPPPAQHQYQPQQLQQPSQQLTQAEQQRHADQLYRDTMAYAKASAEVDADAEFDILHEILTDERPQAMSTNLYDRPPSSRSLLQPPPTAAIPRQQIDNYHFPPKLYEGKPTDAIITTVLNTVNDPPVRASTHHSGPFQPFQYTQTLYQPQPTKPPSSAFTSYPPSHTSILHDLTSNPDHSFMTAATPRTSSGFHPASTNSSVPARSFFQPNDSDRTRLALADISNTDLSKYPPVLRQQLQQHLLAKATGIQSPQQVQPSIPALNSSFFNPTSSSRGRSSSPPTRKHLADTSLMSPTRLASYLSHYLHHRTQVERADGLVTDPSKIALTQQEENKLRGVIVELNSLRSSHELSSNGQQIVTSLRHQPTATQTSSAATASAAPLSSSFHEPPKSTLALPKARRVPVASPPRSRSREAREQDRIESAAITRQQRELMQEDARLSQSLVKIAQEKATNEKREKKHAKQLKVLTKNRRTIDTGLHR